MASDDRLRIDAVPGKTPELTRDRNDPRYQEHLMQRLAPVLEGVQDEGEAIAIIKQFLENDLRASAGMPVPKQGIGKHSDEEVAREWARENPLSAAVQQNAHAFSKGVLAAATAGPYAASRVLESVGVPRKYLINEIPDPAVAGADLRAGFGSLFEIPSLLMDPGKLERSVRDIDMVPDARSPQETRDIEAMRAFHRGAQGGLHEKGLPGQLATLPGDLGSMFIPMGAAGKFTKGAGLLEQAFVRGNVMASTDLAKQEQGDEPELTLEQSGRRAVGSYLGAFSSVAGTAAAQLPGAGATQRIISSALADASAGGLVGALTAQPIGDTLTGNFAPDALEQSLYGAGTNLIGTIMDVPGIRAAARGDANALARIESAEAAERADANRIKSIEAEKAAAAAKAAAEAERSARLAAVLGVTESKMAPNSDRGVRAAIDVDAAMGIGRPTFFPSSASIYDAPANPSLPGRRAGGQYRPDDLLPPPAVDTPVEQTSAVDIYAKTPERMASKPKGSRSSPGGESYGLKDDLSGLKDEELDLIAGDDAAIASIAKEASLTPKSVKIMVKREKAARAAKAPEAPVQPDPVVEAVEQPRVDGPGAVYHAGELSGSGRLIHAGSEAAAKFVSEKAGGRLYRATDLPKNPVTMVDSGRAHDPARVMEDIVAMNEGDERLRLLSQRVKYELSNGGERAAEEVMIKGLEKFGYDGIKYQNVNEDPGSTSYIMFSGKGGFEAVGQDPAPARTEIPREEIDPEDPFGPPPSRPDAAPITTEQEAQAPAQAVEPGPEPSTVERKVWTESIISKSGKVHSRSDNIIRMINMPDDQFRALTSPNDLPPDMAAKYAGGSRGNERFIADLQMALRRRTGESIETGGQGDEAAPDFVIGEEGARPMLNESPDPADAAAAREAWEKRTGRRAPDEMYSGIPIPKEVRDAIDAAVFQGIEMVKSGAKDAALKAKGFIESEIAILKELANGNDTSLPDLRNQMMVRYHGSGVYEEEPGRLSMAAAIKSKVPSRESFDDFAVTQLGMLKKGITDPAGALEDSYELTERIRTRAAKVLSPEARKWLSVGPRNDALRQMLNEYDSSVRVSNAELVDAAIATNDISPEDSHALWLAGETGEGKLSPELQRVVDLKDRVVDDAATELKAIGKLSQETWNDFHRQGSRYQRRFMSKEGLIAKGLERKNQLRRSYDPYAEEALDSIASGPDGVIKSMTKHRKYRSVEDAIANKFITDHRATIQTIREVSAVAATLKLMRGIKEKFPELWTAAPKSGNGIPKKPPAGSSWVLADGPGWGALEGEWVHKDIAGSLSHLVKPRESGFYGFLKWTNSRLGGGLVMGSLGTIVKSTGFEGFMINMRNGVGLMRQRALWKDFIRAYRSCATTGKIDDTIRKLMQGGEWEVEARDYRNAVDEGLDPALRPQMKDVTSTGIKTYSKEFWNQYKAVLESYLTDVDQRGGGFWDRAQARGEAMAQGAFGFKLFNMLGMKADKLSGQGMIDLARFLDQGHRYVLLKAMTTDPGTTLPHQLYKMATGKKYRPVSDDLAIKLVKENFDMRENPAWVNALADHPFGIRFLRPRYKALHNAVVRGGVTRNPFGYAVAGNLAYIAKAAFLATNSDVDNEELSKQQQIAADAYNIPVYDLAPLFRDSKGGIVFGDMSFFSVSGLVPEVITGSEGMARSGNVVTDFFRGVASQSPMLQAGMSLAGYDVYRNSAGNAPDVTAPIKALTPTAGIIAAMNRIKTNSYYEKEGLQPRFSTMDQASRFFTGVATIYTGAPGSALNRQLKSKAKDNAQRREYGTHQITVANEGDGSGRRSRRRRRR